MSIEKENAALSDIELDAIRNCKTWSDFLKLPWQTQQDLTRLVPQLPEALKRRHFAATGGGLGR